MLHIPDKHVAFPSLTRITPQRMLDTRLLIAALTALTTSCLEAGSACTFDAECATAQRCVQSSCYNECASNEDCLGADVCTPLERGGEATEELAICTSEPLSLPGNNATNTSCGSDEACEMLFLDERARCSLLSTCIIPPEEHALLIRDTSQAEEPSAQLLAAYVEDDTGTYVGPLLIESYAPSTPLDSPAQGTWNQANAMALSCTEESLLLDKGTARLYLSTEGERALLENGWRVVLAPRAAPLCDAEDGQAPSSLELSLCVSLEGDLLEDELQCTRMLPLTEREEVDGELEAIVNF